MDKTLKYCSGSSALPCCNIQHLILVCYIIRFPQQAANKITLITPKVLEIEAQHKY
jgi:hypothetical protein